MTNQLITWCQLIHHLASDFKALICLLTVYKYDYGMWEIHGHHSIPVTAKE